MKILEVMKQRKSVRKFLPKEVTDEQIKLLMEAAMSAPSAVDKRPWTFYIARSEEVKEKVRKAMPFGKYNSSIIIVPCVNEFKTFPGEQHSLAYCDLGAVTENILLEAVELGLGTVWCAIYPSKKRMKAIKEALDLPMTVSPYSAIYVGYEDGEAKPKDKFDEDRIHIL